MEGNKTNKQRCKCCNFRPEFWIALLDLRNQLYPSALVDFMAKGMPFRTGHLHELLGCIDDYLDFALREGYFDGSQ